MSIRFSRKTRAFCLALSCLIPAGAWSSDTTSVDIAAQDLIDAMAELARETGLQVLGPDEVLNGRTSVAVEGVMTPRQALTQMLNDTDLQVTELSDGTLIVSERNQTNTVSRNADGDEVFDLGTVVVSGELIERDLQDSQTSAVVVQPEELESGISTDFSQVIQRTPGISNSGGIAIRGITVSPNGISGERTINVQVDGATFGVSTRLDSTNFSTWDLEQVEILRGPQSTQTGRNALAGAIVVRSRDPEYVREARVKLGYGSFDTGQAAIALNTPLVEDRLALRFSFDRTITDGEITNPNPTVDNFDSDRRTTARLGLRWDPTDQLSAVLKFSHLKFTEGSKQVNTATLPDFINTFDNPDREDQELNTVNLRVTYDINNAWRLVSSTSFSDFESLGIFDASFTGFPLPTTSFTGDSEWFEQEVTLNYSTDRTSAVLGAYYYSENATLGANLAPLFTSTLDEDVVNYAIFGEIEHDFTDRWTGIAGFRYDVEEGDVDQLNVQLGVPIPSTFDYNFDAFLPKVGVVYSFDDTKSLGLVYQRGYRSGGVGINRLGVANEFNPEFTDNLELSWRSEFYDGNLIVNANAFYTEWTDRQVRVNNPPTFADGNNSSIVNIGSSDRYGFELDFRAQPTANLSLFGGLAYAEDETVVPRVDPATLLTRNVVSDSDETTAVFGGRYDFDNDWYVSGTMSYIDPLDRILDERTLVDVQVGVRRANWNAYLFATNLFDENYLLARGQPTSNRGDSRRIGFVVEATF
ncbi:MAG: TonB-dependent receptor [Pseudomonadota bacterium]